MQYSINIPKLFSEVFGINGFIVKPNEPGTSTITYSDIPTNTETLQPVETSLLGTPVYEVIQLQDGKETYKFSHTTIVDVVQKKVIEKTKIQGQDGSVKEYINTDDYEITIRGFIVGKNQYPAAEVQEFLKWWKKNRDLDIIGYVLNSVFGIYTIVLEELEMPRLDARPGVQPFQITATSDIPLEVQLRTNNVTIR